MDILVVDDNEDMCRLISDILSDEGYNVHMVYSGKAAMEKIKENAYDLMVLDYKLYDINGLKVLEEIRGQHPELFTIMISAYGNDAVRSRAAELGVYEFLDKPFDLNVLLGHVKKLCGLYGVHRSS